MQSYFGTWVLNAFLGPLIKPRTFLDQGYGHYRLSDPLYKRRLVCNFQSIYNFITSVSFDPAKSTFRVDFDHLGFDQFP